MDDQRRPTLQAIARESYQDMSHRNQVSAATLGPVGSTAAGRPVTAYARLGQLAAKARHGVSRLVTNIRKIFSFFSEFGQDLYLYLRYNGHSPLVPGNRRLFYRTVIETHAIEKGLSLGKPRPLFGKDKIHYIMASLRRYDRTDSAFPVEMGLGALAAYVDEHRSRGIEDTFLDTVDKYVGHAARDREAVLTGGVKFVLPPPRDQEGMTPQQLLLTRTSCRMFQPVEVPPGLVEDVVRLAQSAPSQCNRQATRAHFYRDKPTIDRLLQLQAGSAGFADTVRNLFVISSELSAWGGAQQRNQLYVDGALFAMNLLLACRAYGLASCPLNLAVGNATERGIRRVGNIPSSERLVVMIAIGYAETEALKAASSPRRALGEVLSIH